MELAHIRMSQWLGANERDLVSATDGWYLKFANQLFPIVKKSPHYSKETQRDQAEAAMSLSIYLQDAIAQTGGWKIFTMSYKSLYGTYLPFYELTDSYVPDEINVEDIAFVLWTLKSHIAILDHDFTLQDPYDEHLLSLARQAYDMMDAVFEEAPISAEPSSFLWVMGPDLLDMRAFPVREITPESKLTEDVKRSLEYSGGKQLLYFATYNQLRKFLIDVLKWENKPTSLLPQLKSEREFVVYVSPKGMLIAHNVAAYFCEEHNPMYNARRARKWGYTMFCSPGACPFDLLKYAMAKNLLPDVQLPFPRGKELLNKYWDFFSRYYLYEYYEANEEKEKEFGDYEKYIIDDREKNELVEEYEQKRSHLVRQLD